MILTEGRSEYESQLAQWHRGTERNCSVLTFNQSMVYPQGTSGVQIASTLL